jgi:hypothetical protein
MTVHGEPVCSQTRDLKVREAVCVSQQQRGAGARLGAPPLVASAASVSQPPAAIRPYFTTLKVFCPSLVCVLPA